MSGFQAHDWTEIIFRAYFWFSLFSWLLCNRMPFWGTKCTCMLLEDTGFAYSSHIYLTRVTWDIFQHLISFGLTEFHTTPHSIYLIKTTYQMGNNIAHGPFLVQFVWICSVSIILGQIIFKCGLVWKKISLVKRSFKLTPGFVVCASTKIGLL